MWLPLLVIAGLAGSSPASTQDVWQESGRAAPDPSRSSRDGFAAMMLVTDDSEAFWRAWNVPTPPHLPTTGRAVRGRPVTGMVIFSGCSAAPDGNCNVTAEFVFLRPDGSRYGEPLRGDLWKGPPATGQNLQLGIGGAALIVEPDDPMGVWTIRALVTDNVRGVTIQIEERVTVDTPPAPATTTT
jgi:hypothetical protein